MLLHGNNTIVLTPAALMAIVQKHLRDADRYSDEAKASPIRVTGMRCSSTGTAVVEFTVTTDAEVA